MDDMIKVLWMVGTFGFLLISFVLTIAIDDIFFTPTKDEMCQSIGMKEYLYMTNTPYCIDYDGEAHFVNIKCKGFMLNKECNAQIISIGDIRIT